MRYIIDRLVGLVNEHITKIRDNYSTLQTKYRTCVFHVFTHI